MTDADLLHRYVRHRDNNALAEIVRRHGGMVLATARRVLADPHDAEDVAQSCFIEFIGKADRVNVNLGGFLHRLATRRAVDRLREKTLRHAKESAAAAPDATAIDQLWCDIKADLDEALMRIDEPERDIIIQCCLMGRSQREVANELAVNQSTVTRRLAAAMEELRRRLGASRDDSSGSIPALPLLTDAMNRHAYLATPPAFVRSTLAALKEHAPVAAAGTTAAAGGGAMLYKLAFVTAIVLAVTALAASGVWLVLGKKAATIASPTTAAATGGPDRALAAKLYLAVDRDDLPAIKSLLTQDKRLASSKFGQQGETPLHHARSAAAVQALLDAGADPNARDDKYNARPIRWCVNDWQTAAAKLLAEKAGIDEDVFFYAATGELAKVEPLLAADPSLVKKKSLANDVLGRNGTLLHIAANYGQPAMCELLLKHGADLAAQGRWFDAQPLEVAAWAGFPDVVAVLLEHGADVNAIIHSDQGERTALWIAAITGRRQIVQMLLDHGATVRPEMIDAVQDAIDTPYPGRALPPREDYEAVIDLLNAHVRHPA